MVLKIHPKAESPDKRSKIRMHPRALSLVMNPTSHVRLANSIRFSDPKELCKK
jgi:hypothetical protein